MRTGILDLDYHFAAAQEGAQHHLAAFGPLDAVAEQIGRDALEVQGMELPRGIRRSVHPQPLKARLAPVNVDDFLHDDVGIDDARVRLEVVLFEQDTYRARF